MAKKDIELEIRGEIKAKEIPHLERKLVSLGFRRASITKRTSVMSFGTVDGAGKNWRLGGKDEVDIRCRITNGKAEIVAKIGRTSAANRVEVSVPVSRGDMLRFARLFGVMPFFTKVGSKVTANYQKGSVVVSLVKSPSGLAYIEIEKMTDRSHEKQDMEMLKQISRGLRVKLWKSHQQFIDFCSKLTKQDDWQFRGTPADVKRLARAIR